ncbi:hypothetical protein [Vibrio ponticus]|uniref:hypothetical protein n=1 Tax=Vibrio ponticus TaxID=265668 RepID=UPI0035D4A36F
MLIIVGCSWRSPHFGRCRQRKIERGISKRQPRKEWGVSKRSTQRHLFGCFSRFR